jgi:hypothetical protein
MVIKENQRFLLVYKVMNDIVSYILLWFWTMQGKAFLVLFYFQIEEILSL